jgi:hypothetical protein
MIWSKPRRGACKLRAMSFPNAALRAGFDFVRRNPMSMLTVAREAAHQRVTIPLDLVRWGLGQIRSERVSNFSVSSQPPGLGIALTVSVMGSNLRVGGVLHIDQIDVGPGTLRITLRLTGLAVDALDGPAGPIQGLLSSGAIDLKKPGNLVSFLPKKPAFLVEAQDDRFVLDLMKMPALGNNPRVNKIIGAISPVLSIRDVGSHDDALFVGLRIRPAGLPHMIAALRG